MQNFRSFEGWFNIPLYEYSTFCFSFYLLMDTLVASTFWALWIMLFWTWVYRYLWDPAFSSFRCIHGSGIAGSLHCPHFENHIDSSHISRDLSSIAYSKFPSTRDDKVGINKNVVMGLSAGVFFFLFCLFVCNCLRGRKLVKDLIELYHVRLCI